jgi:MFS family permease
VHEALAGNAETLGFLFGASGMGAICGTVLLATRRDLRGLARFSIAAAFASGSALCALSYSRTLALSIALMSVIGFSMLVISVSINMILQTIVDDDKRGRVMSLYTASFLGVMPFGGLLAGIMADHIGAAHALLVGGTGAMLAALYMARRLPLMRSHLRPIYARLGIKGE